MKLTSEAKPLAAAVAQAAAIIKSRPPLAILGNVLLEAKDGILTIASSDLDMRLELRVPCEVKEPGSITLPALRLSNALNRMDGAVALTTKEMKATLKSERMHLELSGLDASDFPPGDKITEEHSFKWKCADFVKWLDKLAPAMAIPAMGRPNLECVGLLTDDGLRVHLVAANGKTISTIETPFVSESKINASIPAGAVLKLRGMPPEGDAAIRVSKTAIQVSADTWTLSSKLLELEFPALWQYIPADDLLKREIRFDRREAASAIAFAGVTNDSSDRLLISAEKDVVTFGMTGADTGSSVAMLTRKDQGENQQLALNARYLKDAIGCCEEPEFTMRLIDANHPCVIREGNFLHVISPMRIGLK